MSRATVAIGAAEVIGAVGIVIATFTISAVADMALAWRVLAVFMIIEGGNRLLGNTSA